MNTLETLLTRAGVDRAVDIARAYRARVSRWSSGVATIALASA